MGDKFRVVWWIFGLGLIVFVIYASLTSTSVNVIKFQFSDKLGHFVAYFVLTVWFGQLYHRGLQLLVLAILLIGLGVGLEYVQGLSRHRFFEFADMVANSVGVLMGWWLCRKHADFMLQKVENKLTSRNSRL